MNLLLVRTGGLGDSILTLPVARHLRRSNPASSLHVLGNSAMLAVSRLTALFDGFHSIDTGGFHALFSEGPLSRSLRDFFSRYDETYVFSSAPGEMLRRKIEGDAGVRLCRVLDPREPENAGRHIVSHLLEIVGAGGGDPDASLFPPLQTGPGAGHERTTLVIHPGSGGASKNWPLDRFLELAGLVDAPVRIVLGPVEDERGAAGAIPRNTYPVVVTDTLESLCGELGRARAYLGNDSGVSHLAAVCGIPTVALFGPTDPAVWRPVGRRVRVVRSCDGTMDGIGVTAVYQALQEVMGGT